MEDTEEATLVLIDDEGWWGLHIPSLGDRPFYVRKSTGVVNLTTDYQRCIVAQSLEQLVNGIHHYQLEAPHKTQTILVPRALVEHLRATC